MCPDGDFQTGRCRGSASSWPAPAECGTTSNTSSADCEVRGGTSARVSGAYNPQPITSDAAAKHFNTGTSCRAQSDGQQAAHHGQAAVARTTAATNGTGELRSCICVSYAHSLGCSAKEDGLSIFDPFCESVMSVFLA
mmetsp:Transcript_100008/g.173537  ORF Transcript_100008/g.173537 Transcript_100008/m.173537 type:complete len:138 (+) Transcript_100008:2695-3108(+)